MARYDRIARLDPPARGRSFPGWLVLRDLEGWDREAEIGRRARLRFLAVRPVRRLLDSGFDAVPAASLTRQLDHVRREVDRTLGARDTERIRLVTFLRDVDSRSPRRVAAATSGMGEAAHAAGHRYAAEEFFLTALAVAETHGVHGQRLRSMLSLGRLHGDRAEWGRAHDQLEAAAALADGIDDALGWGRAVALQAAYAQRSGKGTVARAHAARLSERAAEDDRLQSAAAAALCAIELGQGRTEAAFEAGWQAVDLLPATDEDRSRILLDLGAAFRSVGLRTAAESCYVIVMESTADPTSVEARIEFALAAAEVGDVDAFEARRSTLLGGVNAEDAQGLARVHLGLGRGAIMIDQIDDARDHVRQAMTLSRSAGLTEPLSQSEEILSGLERRVEREFRSPPATPTDGIRTVAERIESLGKTLVASG